MAADTPSLLQQLDNQLESILKGWNIYTTIIFLILVSYLIYPLFFTPEPDTHPMLLVRQATASQVRQPGESAIYRSLETPHSYPLKTGLNVKDPGAPRWSSGKDGDLRDVWRRTLSGAVDNEGKPTGQLGKVTTVLGKDEVIEHKLEKLTAEINAVGKHLQGRGRSRVAIYLPNSAEFLVAFFASIFYGLTPILGPQELSLDNLAGILAETKADVLVAGAGRVPLKELLDKYPSLKQVIWVVERTSRHMDWNEVPEGEGGKADIAVWHDVIDDNGSSSTDLPTELSGNALPNVITIAEDPSSAYDSYEAIEFTQKNLVSAIGSQLSVLPRTHRLSPTDLLTPLAPLTDTYPLVLTLAALFSSASLALTPVSGRSVPYTSAFQGRATPTIVIAGSQTLSLYNQEREHALLTNKIASIRHWWKARSLIAGVMPKVSPTTATPRLIYTYTSSTTSTSTPPLSPTTLHNLRLFTSSRLIYAFTDPHVAGAVAQTNMLDYRQLSSAHFGPPLSSLEFQLKEADGRKIGDENPVGLLVVSGPAAVGGKVVSDSIMGVGEENTLIYP